MDYTLILTRDRNDSADFMRDNEYFSDKTVFLPLLKRIFIPFSTKIEDLEAYNGIIFTSSAAVRAFSGRFGDYIKNYEGFAFCVGTQTKQAASKAGFMQIVTAQKGTAESLIADIGAHYGQDQEKQEQETVRLLYVRGQHIRRDIKAALESGENIKCDEDIVYEMAPPPVAERAEMAETLKKLDSRAIFTLFSARTAEIFRDLVKAHNLEAIAQNAVIVCISQDVAAIVQEMKCQDVRIAERPSRQSMIEMLEQIKIDEQGSSNGQP